MTAAMLATRVSFGRRYGTPRQLARRYRIPLKKLRQAYVRLVKRLNPAMAEFAQAEVDRW